jgi:PhnB protein
MAVNPVPEGYHSLTPYLFMRGAAEALDYYEKAFGAKQIYRMEGPSGRVVHAEIAIGDSHLMLAEESPQMGHLGPASRGGATSSLLLYVQDVDKAFPAALGVGGKELRPLEDQFWGDRTGTMIDPFGHLWTLATHKEDVPPAEMKKREKEFIARMGG